ncbi:MAG TPA: hypothetical protein VJ815_08000, partial [Acidimicrobiia bacterium]|nr:hypothetical protein [Acidimicrobiia bacterium]
SDENIDIDLYLYRSGQLVASSTAPGTAEHIELVEPADGTYTLFVHGWDTAGETVAYGIHSWNVAATPDAGSLSVTSEPEDATIGATETIEVAWTGLDPGTNYLGVVGHNDDEGLFQVTLVEVST